MNFHHWRQWPKDGVIIFVKKIKGKKKNKMESVNVSFVPYLNEKSVNLQASASTSAKVAARTCLIKTNITSATNQWTKLRNENIATFISSVSVRDCGIITKHTVLQKYLLLRKMERQCYVREYYSIDYEDSRTSSLWDLDSCSLIIPDSFRRDQYSVRPETVRRGISEESGYQTEETIMQIGDSQLTQDCSSSNDDVDQQLLHNFTWPTINGCDSVAQDYCVQPSIGEDGDRVCVPSGQH